MTLNEYASRRTDITESDTVKERETDRETEKQRQIYIQTSNFFFVILKLMLWWWIRQS